ncbi:DUF5615 family PIN-like protein [Chlorogloea sp. CCALA 695]|uniref:DUF5615 family PIN-like protein n=1 Tax=Chlorogloea sp. CCALA 695 TaxID=2107693 RepID=UPI001E330054|nr:DUF5615 family PIN-like protein [Chlorogloea sp. CCALA 695]
MILLQLSVAALMSKPDSVVLEYTRLEERVLLTRNCDDFQTLQKANQNHPGILAVYQHPDPSKSMSYLSIVKSIANIEASDYSLANQFISLNQWNY